jgi:hypothetical protein
MKAVLIAAILGYAGLAHAGNGTLVVDVAKADGHAVAADCEVRTAGATALLKKVAAGTGMAQTGLAAGSYDVACKSRIGGLAGVRRVSVLAGKTSRFKITVAADAAASTALTGTLVDAAGKPITGKVEIVLVVDAVNGKFNAGTLAPGRYVVRYQGSGTQALTAVSVVAGRPASVALKAGPAPGIVAPVEKR